MEDRDLYWLAGLLEGEGSFLKGPPSAPNNLRIALAMTDKDVVERVRDLFGVQVLHTRQPKEAHWKVSYQTLISGIKAMTLMLKLQPLMGERRQQQIQAALESHSPTYKKDRRLDSSRFTEEQIKGAKTLIQEGKRNRDIAEETGLPPYIVRDIKSGKAWAWV